MSSWQSPLEDLRFAVSQRISWKADRLRRRTIFNSIEVKKKKKKSHTEKPAKELWAVTI